MGLRRMEEDIDILQEPSFLSLTRGGSILREIRRIRISKSSSKNLLVTGDRLTPRKMYSSPGGMIGTGNCPTA